MPKTALITGASTGLGISLAVQSAQAGYKVYATMRNLDKRNALDSAAKASGITLEVRQLDVTNLASIDLCVAEIIENDGKIDALINNAGAGFIRTTEQATEEEVQWVLDVNFMGVFRCTKAVIPHMREVRNGHVINISSVGGLVGQPFNEIYCAAKFAVEGYTEAMASYVTPAFGVNFTAIEPGGISTEFANNVLAQVGGSGGILEDEYKPVLEKYLASSRARATRTDLPPLYQTADQVAEHIIACLESDNPPIRMRTSEWSKDLCDLKTQADPDGSKLQFKIIEEMLGGLPVL